MLLPNAQHFELLTYLDHFRTNGPLASKIPQGNGCYWFESLATQCSRLFYIICTERFRCLCHLISFRPSMAWNWNICNRKKWTCSSNHVNKFVAISLTIGTTRERMIFHLYEHTMTTSRRWKILVSLRSLSFMFVLFDHVLMILLVRQLIVILTMLMSRP
ncbi:hypothetical protein O6H91_Y210400 [Diphasiastrum complanatum]|nr:hypothetical protein O6H91_Y210400 [Diphasiastrum complanatum]